MTLNSISSFLPRTLSVFAAITAFPILGSAADYTESANGELSADGNAPTSVSFDLGLNTISGKFGSGAAAPGVLDADVWKFIIAPGQALSSINVTRFDASASIGTGSFVAISAGPTISQSSAATHLSNALVAGPGELLGNLASQKHFSAGFGSAPGASGVTSPLGAGEYTFWIQEAGKASVDYTLSFNLVTVPEPSTLAFGTLGLGLLLRATRRHRSQ